MTNENGEEGSLVTDAIKRIFQYLKPKTMEEVFYIGTIFSKVKLQRGLLEQAMEEKFEEKKKAMNKFNELFGEKKEEKKVIN